RARSSSTRARTSTTTAPRGPSTSSRHRSAEPSPARAPTTSTSSAPTARPPPSPASRSRSVPENAALRVVPRGARLAGPLVASPGLGQRSQVELHHLGVVEQVVARPGVGVAALVEHVGPVADLEAAAGVLLDHDHRDARSVDLLDPVEDLVLDRGRQPRRRLV